MARIPLTWKALAVTAAIALAGVYLAGRAYSPRSLPAAAENEYVEPGACARCHTEIAESYRRTGMGRSLFRPARENTIEDYTDQNRFHHAPSDTHYAMIRRDGAYFQRRWQIGFGGKETNVEEMRIDYVLGSGNHARAYLHRTSRGALIELPLGWYSEKGGFWAMSPGFDSRHPQTRRFVSYECIFCHNAYPQIPAGHEAPDSDPIFAGDLPEGIDCQRCHGPGGRHVSAAQQPGAKPQEIRASIVNPARLSTERQMELCMQCHLEPTSTRLPSLVRRFHRGPFSYVPGEPLGDFVLAFDHAPGTGRKDKFEIVGSATYRLRQSQCFLKSKGALNCTTCHNPHDVPRGEQAVQQHDAACRQCHSSPLDALISSGQHPSAADCASCHMPQRRTEDVVHVVMTDHLIQRRPPQRNLRAALAERHPTEAEEYHGDVVPYYPHLPSTGEGALYRAVAQVQYKSNLEQGVADLAREIATQQPRESEFYFQLGAALQSSGKPAEAVAAYERAVQLRPDSLKALRSLADALKVAGQPARSQEILNRALQTAPADPMTYAQYAQLDSEQGRTRDALEKIQKAIALDPDLPGQHTALASLLLAAGEPGRAEAALRDALRVNPYDATARDLTGRVLAGKGELPEALYHFERATRLRPAYGPHLYDYALTLARANRFDEAQKAVEAALRADPSLAEARALLGTLFSRRRQLSAAAREYRLAVELRPDFSQAHLDLARVLAALGDRTGAVEHLRTAAQGGDAAVAEQAKSGLQQLGAQ